MSHTWQYLLSVADVVVASIEIGLAFALPLSNVALETEFSAFIWMEWVTGIGSSSVTLEHFSFSSLSETSIFSIFIVLTTASSVSLFAFGDRSEGLDSDGSDLTMTLKISAN